MPQVDSNGIRLEYERSGPADGPPLLLIHGVGAQLVRWPAGLIAGFETAGCNVIRFDNRDVGLSTHMDHLGLPDWSAIAAAKARSEPPALPYTLADMAGDATGLLDALGIERAHIVGTSLGGMVAQAIAIAHPARVQSLTVIMSDAGSPEGPGSTPEALAALTAVAPDPRIDREGFLEHSLHLNRALGSPGYPARESDLRGYAAAAAHRAYNPAPAARQLAASRGSQDRRAALSTIDLPTLVVHGAQDPLILPDRGETIARCIPKAWMLIVQGMGHDLPEDLADLFVSAIGANMRRADGWPRSEFR